MEVLFVPPRCGIRLGRQGQNDNRHIVDAPADDQRFGNAKRNAVVVCAHLRLHAQDGVVLAGAGEESRGDHDAVVLRLAVDMFNAVDALDDLFQRLGDEFGGVGALQPVGLHEDVDHWHADLRLFLARNGHQRDEAEDNRRQQDQRRERRADRCAREPPGKAEIHG